MKKIIVFLAMALMLTNIFSQVPKNFKYQSVIRDASGNILGNKNVNFRISILQGNASGTSVYSETQSITTSTTGIANLNIGAGTLLSGNFQTIVWGSAEYFVKIEMDENGGTSYTTISNSQLLSVPYALYAESSNYTNLTNKPTLSTVATSGSYTDLTGKPTLSTVATSGSYTDLTNKPDMTNNVVVASPSAGDIIYYNGTSWIKLAKGTSGQVLTMNATTPYWNTPTASTPAKRIGQIYGGGIIVSVDSTGQHGLVLSLIDMNNHITDYFCATTNNGGGALSYYDGAANSAAIIANNLIAPAATYCKNYTGGGFTDWYLPSVHEWTAILNAGSIIEPILKTKGDLFTNYAYWTSTEKGTNSVYYVDVVLGTYVLDINTNSHSIRAVRKF